VWDVPAETTALTPTPSPSEYTDDEAGEKR